MYNAAMRPFVHLNAHSHYSLLSSLPKVGELVKVAKEDGQQALALTDSGNLYGAIEFYKECEKAGVKPLIGTDAYVALRTRHDKQAKVDEKRHRLILIAADETGYKNLIELITRSHLEGFYYKPRVDREILAEHNQGLIAILPAFSGEPAFHLKNSDAERAAESLNWHKEVFGDRLYQGISLHPEIPGHDDRQAKLRKAAEAAGIPTVAIQEVHYLAPEDRAARETLMSVQQGMRDRDLVGNETDDFSMKTSSAMQELFAGHEDEIDKTVEIASRVSLTLSFGSWVFPDYKVESGLSYEDELRRIVYEGIPRRGLEKTPELVERIEYELAIIKGKGFSPYFLVVGDLLRHARENGILTNIRGSVAGSMVTYLAGITNVNPIEYALPFERFLNPDRPSAPDIDMDYADNRRDEMLAYVRRKYGAEKVAQIGTFGTMLARGAVRDTARALGFPYSFADEIAKLIPMGSQGFPMTIDRALETTPELKTMYDKNAEAREVIDMARKIEGCARHISVHAAGVVIAPTKLTDFTPLQFDPKGEEKVITQYDMYSVEEAGLLKFDFLGLKNLSIIADAVHRIEAIDGVKVDIETIPLDDPKTFAMLSRGDTESLFQLNGEAMTKFLMELKPTSIHDINAMVALYRPGPMQFIPDFIKRKGNPALIRYLDPALEPILSRTYGILVYQDDLLMIAKDIAGYSWGEVDKFRKAVGKKIPEEMAAQKEKFIKGCVTHSGWPQKKAEELWTWIEPFAAYGFNKAHSASYGRVAYQTAYLKANYPAIYLSAVLTADSGDVDRIGETIRECKKLGIPVLPPSVNESFSGFSVVRKEGEPDTIRFGLSTIKNFGEGVAKAIVEERKARGAFTSLSDFLRRVKDRNLNRKSLESLVRCGALDEFLSGTAGERRGTLMAGIELMLAYHKELAKESDDQHSLWDLMGASSQKDISLPRGAPLEQKELLSAEKELLGLYISGHPLDPYREKLESRPISVAKIKANPLPLDVTLGGIFEEVKEFITKKGDKMLFIRFADLTGSIEAVVFPKVLEAHKDVFKPDAVVAIVAKVSKRNGEATLSVEKAKLLE